MLFISALLAFLALLVSVPAQKFEETCEFVSTTPYFDAISYVTYRCGDGKGGTKCAKLNLNNCIGYYRPEAILTWINSVPNTHRVHYGDLNGCEECEYDKSNTYLTCRCPRVDGTLGTRAGVYLSDAISNWGGSLYGRGAGIPDQCMSEKVKC